MGLKITRVLPGLVLASVLLSFMSMKAIAFQAITQTHIQSSEQKTHPHLHKVGIVGKDSRRRLPSRLRRSTKPKIGLLYDKRTGSLCSAFCVAKNVIATAAHCIYNSENRKARHYSSYIFRLPGTRQGYSRLAGYKRHQVSRYIIAGTKKMGRNPQSHAHEDWALVKLANNYCKKRLSLKTASIDSLIKASEARRIFQMAFHVDFKHWKQAYSGPCKVAKSFKRAPHRLLTKNFPGANRMLFHTCDTNVVSSGSPILMKSGGNPVAVAINVGAYQQIQSGKTSTIANTAVPASAFAPFVRQLSRRK